MKYLKYYENKSNIMKDLADKLNFDYVDIRSSNTIYEIDRNKI